MAMVWIRPKKTAGGKGDKRPAVVCAVCGRSFVPAPRMKSHNGQWRCQACRAERLKQHHREAAQRYDAKLRALGRKPVRRAARQRVCVDCGKVFEQGPRCYAKRCQECRDKRRQAYGRWYQKEVGRKRRVRARCAGCGEVFEYIGRPEQPRMYCDACRGRAYEKLEKKKERPKADDKLPPMARLDERARAAREKGVSYGKLVAGWIHG